tara:strand:- start:1231 stop:3081 length:1851 start_codon:yes stop_codon:yes gene_type:complete
MLRTIYQILLKALGKNHPTVRKIAKNLEDQSEQKVTSIPTKTETPDIATTDLARLEEGSKEQIEKIINQFGELSDFKTKGVNRLPIEQQGNAFRNVKRLERKLLQDKQGIMGTDTAKVFDMDTGREVGEKGIKSLLRERGRRTPPGDEGIIGMAEDLKDQSRMIEQDLKPTSTKDFLFGSQPRDRLIADKLGPEAKKMLQEKTPDFFTMGDDYFQASNARIIRQAYENYPPDKADKVVGYYNKLSAEDKLRRTAVDEAQAPISIMLPATRAILKKFSDEGKIKLSPDTLRSLKGQGNADTVDQFEKIFGFDNLEVLDDYVANVAMGRAKTAEELADNFVKDYPNRINIRLQKETKGVLTPRVTDRQILTDREKAQFLTNTGDDGNPLTPEALDYLKRNIEANDPFITKHIMQYSLPKVRGDKTSNYIKNLPDGYDPPDEVRAVLDLKPKTPDPDPELFADGGRVEMASGGITAIKALLRFLAEGRGKKGSELLQEVNPKKVKPEIQNLMLPDDKKMVEGFRVDYLESILDTIKSDKAAIDRVNEMAGSQKQKDALFNLLNSGGNRGRLDVYKTIDPDEAILEIEQMIKNLKLKDMSQEAIKRTMNSDGGLAYMMGE